MSNGWIKLHRDIKDHWIFSNPVHFHRWCLLLLEANRVECKMTIGYDIVTVGVGQSAKSIRTWAALFGCGTKQATNFFNLLESDGMIVRKVVGKGKQSTTLINIENYAQYQVVQKRKGNAKQTLTAYKQEVKKLLVINTNNIVPDGVDPIYYFIVKGFHKLFMDKRNTKQLREVKLVKWLHEIEILLKDEDVTIERLVAVKYYFELVQQGQKGVRDFWYKQTSTIMKFRKKDKEGVPYFIRITDDMINWAKDPDVYAEIQKRVNKLKQRAESN